MQPGHEGGNLEKGRIVVDGAQQIWLGIFEYILDGEAGESLNQAIGSRLVHHPGQRRIVLDVGGYREPEHLGSRQDGERTAVIGDDRQPRERFVNQATRGVQHRVGGQHQPNRLGDI